MHISDNIQLGPAKILQPPNPGDPSPMELGVGPMGRVYLWDVIPAASAANNIALSQSTVGTNQLVVLTAGAGVTTRVGTDNKAAMVLDVPRAVVIAATTGGAPFVVRGLDQYGAPMSETFAAAGTGKKAFKVILSVTAAVAGTVITVGTSSIIGLPYRLTDLGYWISAKVGVIGQFATAPVLADQTDPATPTTGDVRGTIDLAANADGVKRFVALMALPGIASGPNATRIGAVGVTQV